MFAEAVRFSRRDPRQSRRLSPAPAKGPAFTPATPSSVLAWSRSDQGFTFNGSNVSAWGDITGQGRGYSQLTAARQPLYVASGGANNLPYIQLTGGSSQLLRWLSNGYAGTVAEAWVVCRPTWPGSGPATTWQLIGKSTSCNVDTVAGSVNASTLTVQIDDSSTSTAQQSLSQGVDVALLAEFQGAGIATLYKNNSGASNDGTEVTILSAPLGIGDNATANDAWSGFVYEVALYSAVLSSADRANLQAYTHNRYGI